MNGFASGGSPATTPTSAAPIRSRSRDCRTSRSNGCAREAISVPDGLITGPIFVSGRKIEGTGDAGQALNINPDASGVQHCEVAGMRDTLDGFADKLPNWSWLRKLVGSQNWQTKIRDINPAGKVHPTVRSVSIFPTWCSAPLASTPIARMRSSTTKTSSVIIRPTFLISKPPRLCRPRRAERHRRWVDSNSREPAPPPVAQPSRCESTETSVLCAGISGPANLVEAICVPTFNHQFYFFASNI